MSQVKTQSVSSEAQRTRLAREYLSAMQELSSEISSAIGVLVINSLPEFQEHVARQEFLSARLQELALELIGRSNSPLQQAGASDDNLWNEISTARLHLAELNRRYSTFLEYSWKYIGTMTELCRAYGDAAVPTLSSPGQPALSCEV